MSEYSDDNDGWYGYAPVARVASAQEDRTHETPRVAAQAARGSRTRAHDVESRKVPVSGSGTWDFKVYTPRPWYRAKPVLIALSAAAVAATSAAVVLFVGRGPATSDEELTNVAPQTSSSAAPAPTSPAPAPPSPPPAPTSAAPALSTAMPPPPPPPPPPAPVGTAPVVRPNTRPPQIAPAQPGRPEIGVTRAPATRSPISATPPPPPPPGTNSGTPGDGPSRRGHWGPW